MIRRQSNPRRQPSSLTPIMMAVCREIRDRHFAPFDEVRPVIQRLRVLGKSDIEICALLDLSEHFFNECMGAIQ